MYRAVSQADLQPWFKRLVTTLACYAVPASLYHIFAALRPFSVGKLFTHGFFNELF